MFNHSCCAGHEHDHDHGHEHEEREEVEKKAIKDEGDDAEKCRFIEALIKVPCRAVLCCALMCCALQCASPEALGPSRVLKVQDTVVLPPTVNYLALCLLS